MYTQFALKSSLVSLDALQNLNFFSKLLRFTFFVRTKASEYIVCSTQRETRDRRSRLGIFDGIFSFYYFQAALFLTETCCSLIHHVCRTLSLKILCSLTATRIKSGEP